ncbi:MAG: hypothetical protein G01um101466_139 [Parcubacteria group bacterium Gr01-1014_66]|nr:MAG: hypothetical protein G01um101466_139 [Parcubacteria group bacterium Gr01-1014_66]
MHRGVATFTLDYGTCPRWLFERMVKLGREMVRVLIEEYGPDEFVRRMADPVWFQSLGTVLAFDWNASGLTTILTAALKEAIRGEEEQLGIFICGGKGKTSRKTPDEIFAWSERLVLSESSAENLVYNSRMAAKVDSALVQDGFQIYHHSFIFSKNGAWAVVQQGMNTETQTARRYHWFSSHITDLVCEPHAAISSESIGDQVLNLVAKQSEKTREFSTDLVQHGYAPVMKEIELLRKHSSGLSQMITLRQNGQQLTLLNLEDMEFTHHPVVTENFSRSRYLEKILARVTVQKPENYETLLSIEGVGAKTMRALALVGEVIYGAKPSYEDPARYSFAHGGKDATPYPVDRKTYDETIAILTRAIDRMRIDASLRKGMHTRLRTSELASQTSQKMMQKKIKNKSIVHAFDGLAMNPVEN